MIDGSLSSAALSPPAPLSAQLPSALWKKSSNRLVNRSLPPIDSTRPATLCGTIQLYCALVPSTNPFSVPGTKSLTQVPSALRLRTYPPLLCATGSKLFCHHCERSANTFAVAGSFTSFASSDSAKSAVDISRVSAAPPQAFETDGM